jgi:hypothetical protein
MNTSTAINRIFHKNFCPGLLYNLECRTITATSSRRVEFEVVYNPASVFTNRSSRLLVFSSQLPHESVELTTTMGGISILFDSAHCSLL